MDGAAREAKKPSSLNGKFLCAHRFEYPDTDDSFTGKNTTPISQDCEAVRRIFLKAMLLPEAFWLHAFIANTGVERKTTCMRIWSLVALAIDHGIPTSNG